MSREGIAMTQAEIISFLEKMDWVAVGSCDANKRIFAETAPFVLHKNYLVFSVPSSSETVRNIERKSGIVCSTDIFPSYYEIKGVSVHGVPVHLSSDDIPALLKTQLTECANTEGLPLGGKYFGLTLEDSFGFDFGNIKEREI